MGIAPESKIYRFKAFSRLLDRSLCQRNHKGSGNSAVELVIEIAAKNKAHFDLLQNRTGIDTYIYKIEIVHRQNSIDSKH